MPEITSVKQPDHERKYHPTVPMFNYFSVPISATLADNADFITIVDVPVGYMVTGLIWNISATLGASATLQARVGTTAISGASTQGGADTEVQTAYVAPSTSEATLNFLVGGADISGAATLTLGFYFVPAQTVTLP
jgi:hypothetical protein